MAGIKLTKGELKRQRDALWQYERYLPTLQLKKQQLQIEVLRQLALLEAKNREESLKREQIKIWAGLLSESTINIKPWVLAKEVITEAKNIAGVDIPVFIRVGFEIADYDLFIAPLWVDTAIDALRALVTIRQEGLVIEKGIAILRRELRITSQRVNLFEKVKIPEATEAIRLIKIFIGDQLANAVGRSKIAKRKIEEYILEEAAV